MKYFHFISRNIGGLHMTSSKLNNANYNQFAPDFDKTIQRSLYQT